MSEAKPKRITVALEGKPSRNFHALVTRYQEKKRVKDLPLEDFLAIIKPLNIAIANIITIIENGNETTKDDILDVEVIENKSRTDIELRFTRYHAFKKQPIILKIREFAGSVVEIGPAIPVIK